jgi:hypothetical protein
VRHTGHGPCPRVRAALAFLSVGSGLIYALLIGMWAVYFIPRWLRRHEELSESRSIERFDRAMRILSRKDPTPDRRYVVMPPRPVEGARPAQPTGRAGRADRSAPVRSRRATSVAVRRRRVLAGLLLGTVLLAVSAPLAPVPWWGALAGVAVVVGYLAHCRLQARTRHQVDRTRAAVHQRSRSRLMRFDAFERLITVRRELAEERAAEQRRWDEAEAAERAVRQDEERRRAEAEAGWNPVPVPLPTYVSKPVAPRRAPVPEQAGTAAAEAPEPAPSTAGLARLLDDAATAEDELDAIITRRAVND